MSERSFMRMTSDGDRPRLRVEGGAHGAMGVMETRADRPAGTPSISAISDGA